MKIIRRLAIPAVVLLGACGGGSGGDDDDDASGPERPGGVPVLMTSPGCRVNI